MHKSASRLSWQKKQHQGDFLSSTNSSMVARCTLVRDLLLTSRHCLRLICACDRTQLDSQSTCERSRYRISVALPPLPLVSYHLLATALFSHLSVRVLPWNSLVF